MRRSGHWSCQKNLRVGLGMLLNSRWGPFMTAGLPQLPTMVYLFIYFFLTVSLYYLLFLTYLKQPSLKKQVLLNIMLCSQVWLLLFFRLNESPLLLYFPRSPKVGQTLVYFYFCCRYISSDRDGAHLWGILGCDTRYEKFVCWRGWGQSQSYWHW